LNPLTLALVAEKVETQEEYDEARAEGFTLFQGYYFCRPVLLQNRKVPANRLSHIQILQLLHEESIDLRKVTRLVKRDASLTYRLLRLVNSPIYAIREQIRSVQSALMVVGEETFRRIATLAITSELSADQPPEVLRMAFVRGRFCELAAGLCALDSTEQYLLGMLSLLPAMLRLPMEEVTPSLALRDEIRHALEGEQNSERALLQWLECHERGDWAASDAVVEANMLSLPEVVGCFGEAVEWAEAALRSVL
jgi:EAL and modified HD-GYP domain-containing signal transduction protein